MSEDTATSEGFGAGTGLDLAAFVPMAGIVLLWVATVVGGMAFADEAAAAGMAAYDDPGSATNVGRLAVGVLVGTGLIIAAHRLGRGDQLIRALFVALFGVMAGHAVVLLGVGSHATSIPFNPVSLSPVPLAVGALSAAVLWVHPEWYVLDVLAVAGGAFGIASFGIGLEPGLIVGMLVLWAAYDAYSVYVSGHMKEAAGAFTDLKIPALYVVPGSLDFSVSDLDEELGSGDGEETEDGDADGPGEEADDGPGAHLLGLGDSVIPGLLAVSAGQFLDAPAVVPALNANLPAVGALVGGLVGLLGLMAVLHRFEGAHAGHPPLNAGVIGGYLVGALAAGIPLTTALGL